MELLMQPPEQQTLAKLTSYYFTHAMTRSVKMASTAVERVEPVIARNFKVAFEASTSSGASLRSETAECHRISFQVN